jgi:probable DNA metabolism protein
MHRIVLDGKGDLEEWRNEARSCLAARLRPEEIEWHVAGDDDLFHVAGQPLLPQMIPAQVLTVPKAFLPLAEAVLCHRDPGRFARLYSVLYRLQEEPSLLAVRADADVAELHAMERAVRRDSHKMTAFVRFKEIAADKHMARRRFVAWFEPDHYIVRRVAPFFKRRFTDMDWVIATPKGTASWDGEVLDVSLQPAENLGLADETDALWRTYFRNIFNPARLKVKMMQTEMPKKYWKNLPEAALIPDMIAGAEARVAAMAERAASEAPAFHARLQAASRTISSFPSNVPETLDDARRQAMTCTRCPLHCHATQTVFGEGPSEAGIMVVGEQPGDQEDLVGRPFIGPAGKVFDGIAKDVGLDRERLYVTNAVKHFKYELRGKRRIHKRPDPGEIRHCKWWLKLELDLVSPRLVVAMGATALTSLLGKGSVLSEMRGQILPLENNRMLLSTVHPSYLLRIPDPSLRSEETARFHADLAKAAEFQRLTSGTKSSSAG